MHSMRETEENKGNGKIKGKQILLRGKESSISRERYFLALSSLVAVADENSMNIQLQKLHQIL